MDSKKRETMGELMHRKNRNAMKGFAVFMAVGLYGVVLIYTGVHNFNLISRTVPPDQQLFAITALLALEGGAIFLPLAIHFWLAPGPQRMVGYLLYFANFGLVIVNTILDAMTNRAEALPEWLKIYGTFVMPAAPIMIGIGIAVLFVLDPSKKLHDAEMETEAAQVERMALGMREASDAPEVNDVIDAQARARVRRIVGADKPAELPAPAEAQPTPDTSEPTAVENLPVVYKNGRHDEGRDSGPK